MIEIDGRIRIPDDELEFEFIRSPGPGGQNVNKVATSVRLRFDVRRSKSLPDGVRRRLLEQEAGRIRGDGILIVRASRFRTRERNRRDAIERLAAMIRAATRVPRPRRPTTPGAAARRRRLEEKRRRSRIKRQRGRVDDEE